MAIKVYTPSGEVLEPIRAGQSFEMPGLAPGAVIEHEFRMEHGPPELQYTNGPWYLQDPELREPFVHSRWIVIAPKDIPSSYHLSVVVDDAYQGVNLVARGEVLLPPPHVQRLLQALLSLPEPQYAHHGLILDEHGRKFSKRNAAVSAGNTAER